MNKVGDKIRDLHVGTCSVRAKEQKYLYVRSSLSFCLTLYCTDSVRLLRFLFLSSWLYYLTRPLLLSSLQWDSSTVESSLDLFHSLLDLLLSGLSPLSSRFRDPTDVKCTNFLSSSLPSFTPVSPLPQPLPCSTAPGVPGAS